MQEKTPGHAKYAFVCATPYQIYNALTFMFAERDKYDSASDLFIVGGFTNAQQVAETLREMCLFHHVVFVTSDVDAYGLGERKTGRDGEIRSLEALVSYLESCGNDGDWKVPSNSYDEILFSLPTLTAAHLVSSSPDAKLVLFDDGYGSYYDNILDASGWEQRIPNELHVWFPQMCDAKIGCPIYDMPHVDDADDERRFAKCISDVFGYEPLDGANDTASAGGGSKMIFMSQPISEEHLKDGAADIIRDVLSAGCDMGMQVLAKPHPRETPSEVVTIDEAVMDERGLSLEVLCINNEIDDDTILVGSFSTSQYLPAMMFGVKPRLLFLYRILLADAGEIERLDALADEISVTYGKAAQDKICVANTLDEALDFLR